MSISKGDRVEAKLKGWTKYYKGKITRENRDGTYDILFDDGERKSKVDAKLIKSLLKRKRPRKRQRRGRDSDSEDDDDDDVSLSKGDRVEAKLKGWTKYYKGKITRENRDGTYDILFDDGDRKSKVDAKLIKSLEKKKTKKKTRRSRDSDSEDDDDDDVSLSKGDRVEAKLKGWTKYYKGKITRENRDGTYDILFDDGERKSKVDAKLIKSLEKKKTKKKTRRGRDSDSDDSDDDDDDVSLSKGDRVEAKLKGWTKYYKGKITRENRDGTYDILFDDGDRKSKVDAKLIKSLETKQKKTKKKTRRGRDSDSEDDDDDDVSLSKGDRVEAKLKGWTKYYKGKITRENRDGTYDI